MEKAQPKYSRIILIALLLGITASSIFKYVYALKEKYELLNTVNQIKAQLSALEAERQVILGDLDKEKQLSQQLIQESTVLKDDLKTREEKIAQLSTDVAYAQKIVEELNSQVSILKAENMAVRDQNNGLTVKLSQVSQEKEALQLRLSSVAELKKAIRELKKQMRKVHSEIKFKEEVAGGKVLEGNRGFLVKNGKPTYPTKVKIEVKSLSLNE
jgi:DNA repair exonuclease SbcCD ATPase subunit